MRSFEAGVNYNHPYVGHRQGQKQSPNERPFNLLSLGILTINIKKEGLEQ